MRDPDGHVGAEPNRSVWRRVLCLLLWHQRDAPSIAPRSPYASASVPDDYEHRCRRCGTTSHSYHLQSVWHAGRSEARP